MNGLLGQRTYGNSSLRLTMCAAVPKEMQNRVREITSLYTKEGSRGKGSASRLMQKTCKEADNSEIVLIISPKPFDADGLDAEALTSFYARHGFMQIQEAPLLMARQNGR